MASSRANCEIVEAKDEPSTTSRMFCVVRTPDRDLRPVMPKGPNYKSLEDDINKLFEAVNLRTLKSLDFADPNRNASKRPIRGISSHSPGTGFSTPVSLKQSLRGLCISQAAEMAAMKRILMPSSPRVSEAGKITNLCRSVVESSGSHGHAAESISSSPHFNFVPSKKVEHISCESESSKQSPTSSMQFPVSSDIKGAGTSLMHKDIESDVQLVKTICFQDSEQDFPSVLYDNIVLQPNGEVCGLNKNTTEDSAIHTKTAAPKLRRKLRPAVPLASSVKIKSNREPKSATSRAVKPVLRNKPVTIKKPKKVAVSTGENINRSCEENASQLICQRCQCSLTDLSGDATSHLVPEITFKNTVVSKSNEKGEITQSSRSSDFSSTITSLSEERNLSGLIFGNRPHMPKDMRWEAIDCIRRQYGFLGLSSFNLLRKLGSGDIGTVYLAELKGTNCAFAIKVMDNEFLARRKKMPRAQTEREILRMLDHPFLPTLYAQFTSDNMSCLVMEFCPGGDLHVLRQRQPCRFFPEQVARFYVAEVLLALEYLHMLGIVYRDLKPENILVREDGHIMLTDFDLSLRCSVNPILVKLSSLGKEPPRVSGPCAGSNCIDPFCTGPSCEVSCFRPRLLPSTAQARKLKAESAAGARSLPQLIAEPTEARSNSFVGTHEYLAPEIVKGEGHGSAVDWWTFGVFLYELLYGKTPFKGANNDETLDNVVLQNLRFPDIPIVSFHARDLIRRLLVKEPENRLGTETGAAEIKRHPFFDGLNWALIRCTVPPEVPDDDVGNSEIDYQEKGENFMDCSVDGKNLEFELF